MVSWDFIKKRTCKFYCKYIIIKFLKPFLLSFQSFFAQRGVIELCSGALLADVPLTKKSDSARPQTVGDVMNHYQHLITAD